MGTAAKLLLALNASQNPLGTGHSEPQILLPMGAPPSTMVASMKLAQSPALAVNELRKSTRVPLTLPIRLRWQGALGQTIEITQTLDSSRGGLLFFRTEALPVNARLWVTFPYSADSQDAQPETPAHVVRIKTTPGGGQIVAIEFEKQPRPASVATMNRRNSQRMALALPITVRFHEIPWPEHTMTQDVSTYGVLFRTPRQYALGDVVCVSIPHGVWARRGEMEGHVVRIDSLTESQDTAVALALSVKNC